MMIKMIGCNIKQRDNNNYTNITRSQLTYWKAKRSMEVFLKKTFENTDISGFIFQNPFTK